MPVFATLAVADISRVAAWYQQALGFNTMFEAPGPAGQPALVHLRRRKYQDLLLVPASEESANAASLRADASQPATSITPSITLTFSADGEVDLLAERARQAAAFGAAAVVGPVDTGWNTRDLRVTDPAGHRLVFTSRQANPDPARMGRWKALFDAAGTHPDS